MRCSSAVLLFCLACSLTVFVHPVACSAYRAAQAYKSIRPLRVALKAPVLRAACAPPAADAPEIVRQLPLWPLARPRRPSRRRGCRGVHRS